MRQGNSFYMQKYHDRYYFQECMYVVWLLFSPVENSYNKDWQAYSPLPTVLTETSLCKSTEIYTPCASVSGHWGLAILALGAGIKTRVWIGGKH